MKLQTKLKFVHWIERLLKIDYTSMAGPLIVEKTRDIQTATAWHIYPKWEMKKIDKHQIQFGLNFKLVDALMEHNAIKYRYIEVEEGTQVVGEIKFIVE